MERAIPVLTLIYVLHLCKLVFKGDILKIPTNRHHCQKSRYLLFYKHPLYQPQDTHRGLLFIEVMYFDWKAQEDEDRKNAIQHYSTVFATTPKYILISEPKSLKTKPKEKKSHSKRSLALWWKHPYNSWRHTENNEYKWGMDYNNGFSDPSAMIPSGWENPHGPSSLDTLQRGQVFKKKKKRKSCYSSVLND